MKSYKNKSLILCILIGFTIVIGACSDDDVKATIKSPSSISINLEPTASSIVLDSANAASAIAETFTWDAADFGVVLSVNYTLQVDSVNGDFSRSTEVNLGDELTKSYTKKELNSVALSLGLEPEKAGDIKFRIKATVNPKVETIYSNVVALTITPYSTKPTPKFPVPDNLYIVGDATVGDWGNPVPTPSQQFTRIDETTFGIVIQLKGGKQYLFLPVNGDWGHKYNPPAAGASPEEDSFEPDAGGNNIPGPVSDGLYKIIVDFVKGTYKVTALTSNPVPPNLFIVGDATAGEWNNPVPVPSQQFTQVSNAEFQITIPLTGGKSYLFLPVNGDWGHKYGGTEKSGGELLADGAVPGSNTPAPDVSGNYIITVNFLTNKYTVIPE